MEHGALAGEGRRRPITRVGTMPHEEASAIALDLGKCSFPPGHPTWNRGVPPWLSHGAVWDLLGDP